MSLKAFLLCAGEGTRFRPHTLTLPKPLIPFLNIPLCAYNLYLLKTLKVQNIIVNTHAHPHLLEKNVKILAHKAQLTEPTFSFEEQLLGAGGGLLKVRDFFNSKNPFFYLNGDSFIWPESKNSLLDFYSSHVKSGALCSFLVRPVQPSQKQSSLFSDEGASFKKTLEKGYIYAEHDRICSFSHPRAGNTKTKPYEWSGLALFSPLIFNEIEQALARLSKVQQVVGKGSQKNRKGTLQNTSLAGHIFKDILNPILLSKGKEFFETSQRSLATNKAFQEGCRIHSVPHLKLLDMNQLSSYLKGTKIALEFLRTERGTGFLQKILDLYTPDWRRYEGDNWFSATPLTTPPRFMKDMLFCGPELKGLNQLLVKGFAVLGKQVTITSPLVIEQSVLGQRVHLKTDLKNTLKL